MGRPRKSGNAAKKAAKKAENERDHFVETNEMVQQAKNEEQLPEIGFEQPQQEQEAEIEKQVQETQPQKTIQEIKPADLPKEEEIEVKYNVSENDTREMLNYVGISTIPKFQLNAVWVRAIAKVLKIDTSVSWVVLKRTGAKKHNIEKIFGHCAAIKKVGTPIPIEVIPYTYSDAFPRENAEEMARFIANYTKKPIEELRQKNYGELTDMMLDLQIKMYYEESYYNGKPQ